MWKGFKFCSKLFHIIFYYFHIKIQILKLEFKNKQKKEKKENKTFYVVAVVGENLKTSSQCFWQSIAIANIVRKLPLLFLFLTLLISDIAPLKKPR